MFFQHESVGGMLLFSDQSKTCGQPTTKSHYKEFALHRVPNGEINKKYWNHLNMLITNTTGDKTMHISSISIPMHDHQITFRVGSLH